MKATPAAASIRRARARPQQPSLQHFFLLRTRAAAFTMKIAERLHGAMLYYPTTILLLAAGAYTIAGAAIVSKPFRYWLLGILGTSINSTQSHVASLDALRGISALWVAAYHSWQWWTISYDPNLYSPMLISAGYKAVPIFAGLSGFLILRSLKGVAELSDLKRYIKNRCLRILPLYITSVTILAIIGQLGQSTFTAELFLLRSFGYPNFANPPLWSFYVEVLFYLVAPIFVIASGKLLWLVELIGLVVLYKNNGIGSSEYNLWKYFLIGGISAEIYDRLKSSSPEWAGQSIFAVGLLTLCFDVYATQLPAPGAFVTQWITLEPMTIVVALLIVGSVLSKSVIAFFNSPSWRALSSISFSLYVWHSILIIIGTPLGFNGTAGLLFESRLHTNPPPFWTRTLIFLPAAMFLSTLSYVFIEKPFLKKRERTHRPT
jgi:peptidoglycan/LPS O-acetylase OafA/YrhL